MKKLISGLILLGFANAQGMEMAEEAIILNQELEYLRETARVPAVRASAPTPAPQLSGTKKSPSRSLEETYFGDEEQDDVSTRAAGRRRRITDD